MTELIREALLTFGRLILKFVGAPGSNRPNLPLDVDPANRASLLACRETTRQGQVRVLAPLKSLMNDPRVVRCEVEIKELNVTPW